MEHVPLATRPARAPSSGPRLEPTVRGAYTLLADLMRPRPPLYYVDLAATATVGWAAFFGCAALLPSPAAAPLFVVTIFAFLRAASFIHELTHLRPGAVPGFDTFWNLVFGIPMLLPSMLYVGGVHSVHHAKPHYGTPRDPEYLPLAWWSRPKRILWLLHAGALPLAQVLRFAVLAPASAMNPRLRRWVWVHASSLGINPRFARADPPAELRRRFLVLEAIAAVWAIALIVLVAVHAIPTRVVLVAIAASATVGILNQLRTIVSHRFVNTGDGSLTFEAQFLDSVNVPGQRVLTALWAPVGLRYHALHHMLPGLPYHALGAAHRRVVASVSPTASYHGVNEPSLVSALRALDRASTFEGPSR